MVEYKTIKAEEMKFGNNDFIEIARKKAISETGENEFISISRGFMMMDGTKRYRTEIVADNMIMLDSRRGDVSDFGSAGREAAGIKEPEAADAPVPVAEDEVKIDDLPF